MKTFLRSCLSFGYGAKRAFCNCTIVLTLWSTAVFAEPTTVVALGDSLTAGYGLSSEDGFVPQLQGWLAANGADARIVNAGVSGDTTAGGVSRLDWSLSGKVDALIVNLGGNDMLRGLDPAGSRANLEKILQGASSRDLPVLLVGLRAPDNYGPDFKEKFDEMFPALAKQYGAILLKDYFAPIAPEGAETGLLAKYMQADGIHPNAEGVKAIVAEVGPKVLELLAKAKL